MTQNEYPEPKYPSYIFQQLSDEQLAALADEYVRNTTDQWGAIQRTEPFDGTQNVLVVTYGDQDERIADAMMDAMRRQGANQVDMVSVGDLGVDTPGYSAEEGWMEVDKWTVTANERNWMYEEGAAIQSYLQEYPEYDLVYAGIGGRPHYQEFVEDGEADARFQAAWIYIDKPRFLSRAGKLAPTLQETIERQVVKHWEKAKRVRFTDPEGTDFSFELTPEAARLWKEHGFLRQHHLGYPSMPFCNFDAERYAELMEPVFRSTEGTIAGTSNHTGYHPKVELVIEEGQIVEVNGGGKYGERLEEWRARLEDVQYPHLSDPGWFYLHECAIGTLPKIFRHPNLWDTDLVLPNTYQRRRAGVVHFGFGAHVYDDTVAEFGREHDVPVEYGNFIHIFFPTIELKRRDTGEWHTVIDRGRLTALDTTRTRKVASAYGDPDELLSYDWVPKVPGVNVPGEYEEDFTPDPVPVIKEELAGYLQ